MYNHSNNFYINPFISKVNNNKNKRIDLNKKKKIEWKE